MTDTNKYNLSEGEYIDGIEIDGYSKSEALKLSNLKYAGATEVRLLGGSEDCLDVVRGYGIFNTIHFLPSKKTRQSVTAKGSCNIVLNNPWFLEKPKLADIVVGDFTIYDAVDKERFKKKSVVHLKNPNALDDNLNSRKVKVILMNGDLRVIDAKDRTRVKVIKVPSLLVKIYFFFGRLFTSKKRKEQARKTLKEFPDVKQ